MLIHRCKQILLNNWLLKITSNLNVIVKIFLYLSLLLILLLLLFSSVNLVSSTVCSLPEYPNKKNTPGPAIFQYLEDQQVLAACGASDELTVGLTCYQLKAGSPSDWQQMPSSPLNPHCPWPYRTRSHYLNDLGWFVIGQDGSCSYSNADISTDLFTLDQQWIPTSTVSPYKPGFPGGMCSVAINSTHIIFTGGYNGNWLSSTLMLDLTDYSWTARKDMPGPRYEHGCTLTENGGGILIVGGYVGHADINIHRFHIWYS